jgi:DtxR family transcriptional regulator, Mn-dependent transcriptional regulator
VATGYHPPVEEYLSAILELGADGTAVISARLCEHLSRSAPTVKEMIDRLVDDGYVMRNGRVLELTISGATIAEQVVRRHRLAERLLHDVIGLEWHKVHAEAGRWEHVISDDVEGKLVELLGDPATCPHGNPIPGSQAAVIEPTATLMDSMPGSTVEIVRIAESIEHDDDMLTLLGQWGITPGASVACRSRGTDGMDVVGPKGEVMLPERCARGVLVR